MDDFEKWEKSDSARRLKLAGPEGMEFIVISALLKEGAGAPDENRRLRMRVASLGKKLAPIFANDLPPIQRDS